MNPKGLLVFCFDFSPQHPVQETSSENCRSLVAGMSMIVCAKERGSLWLNPKKSSRFRRISVCPSICKSVLGLLELGFVLHHYHPTPTYYYNMGIWTRSMIRVRYFENLPRHLPDYVAHTEPDLFCFFAYCTTVLRCMTCARG